LEFAHLFTPPLPRKRQKLTDESFKCIIAPEDSDICFREATGMRVKNAGQLWKTSMLVAAASFGSTEEIDIDTMAQIVIELYNKICTRKLHETLTIQPHHRGQQITTILSNMTKGTSWSDVMEKQLRWQLCYPNGTAEECAQFLRESFPHFV